MNDQSIQEISEPWLRLPAKGGRGGATESAKNHEAFSVYLELGAGRSVRRVAEALGKTEKMLQRWCTTFNWVARAEAWDRRQEEITFELRQRLEREKRERLAAEDEEDRQLIRALKLKVAKTLERATDLPLLEKITHPDGRVTVKHARTNVHHLARAVILLQPAAPARAKGAEALVEDVDEFRITDLPGSSRTGQQ